MILKQGKKKESARSRKEEMCSVGEKFWSSKVIRSFSQFLSSLHHPRSSGGRKGEQGREEERLESEKIE